MLTFKAKNAFFDKAAVLKSLSEKSRSALSKAGAWIRTRARTSIRPRKGKISPPGQPPYSHEGSLRKLLWFAYEPSSESVVIGPVRFKDGEAPNLLEFGGSITEKAKTISIRNQAGRNASGRFVSGGWTRVQLKAGKRVYKPRPFMGPALQKELPNLPKAWASNVKGG